MGSCESTHSNPKAAGSDDQDLVLMNKDKHDQAMETVKVVGTLAAVAAGVALVGWGVGAFGEMNNKKKMMKAPGRDFLIFRDDFESDPSAYFRSLRN